MEPESYIETPVGRRMLQAVTPDIYRDEYELSIFNANGLIMQEVHDAASKLTAEVLINNATWSLPYWEELFQIKSGDNQAIEHRRRAVILKMNEYFPVTRQRMKAIVETFTESGGVSIDDERGDYIFEVLFRNSGKVDFNGAIEAIEETKPAHFDYTFHAEHDRDWYVGGAMLGAETTILYPFVDADKDISGDWRATGAMYETENVEMEGQFL